MFCPNCGEKLIGTNLNFCPSCGSEISTISEAPQLRTERNRYASTSSSQSTPEAPYPPIIQQKVVKAPLGGPDMHSKRCLGFGITSPILAIPFWGYQLFFWSMRPHYIPHPILQVIAGITILAILIAGLVFGILAKTNSSKARKLELENGLEKVGSVFAIFGIVINAISLVVIIIGPIVAILVFRYIYF